MNEIEILEDTGEERCEVCGAVAVHTWLDSDLNICNNIICDVTLWDIMEMIVRSNKNKENLH